MRSRTIKFLGDLSIGIVSVRTVSSRNDWSVFAEAIGDVVIPTNKEVRIEVSPTIVFDPSIFSTFESNALSVVEWVSTRKVSDAAIAHLRHLTGLKGLALWETNIGDEGLRHLRHLSKLRWLDIDDTRVTDDGLTYLSELSLLKELSLLNDRITDKGIVHLRNLTSLEGLDLMNTSVSDKAVEALRKMQQLRTLRIVNTSITEKGYREIKSALPRCKLLYYHPHHP